MMTAETERKVYLGLSLGAHALVGIAVLPLLDFLEEQDAYVLSRICGSGQGALTAAMIASGKSKTEIQEVTQAFYKERFYNKYNKQIAVSMFQIGPQSYHPSQSLFSCENKLQFCRALFGEQLIEELKTPLTLVATDLYTAEPIKITKGPIYKAVYGASAWFPFHPPIRHQGRLLVSGSFSEAFPVIEEDDIDLEIGINVQEMEVWKEGNEVTDGWAFFDRAFQIMEAPHKSQIRKEKGHNIIPVWITYEKKSSLAELSEDEVKQLYSDADKGLREAICSHH